MPTPRHIDARGLKCPLPVLKVEKHLDTIGPGESFTLASDDPIARIDIPLFCQNNAHTCTVTSDGPSLIFTISKTTK